jgi:hypothetical protein
MTDHPPTTPSPRAGVRAFALGVLALIGVVTAAAPAAAQQSDQPADLPSQRIPGWSFTPSMAFGAIYDNNVGLSDAPAELGRTQGDTYFNIVPGGQLELAGKYTDFSVSYRGFLRRYLEVDGLNGFDQRAALNFRRIVSRRLTLTARDSFSDNPTTDDVELNGVPFRRTGSRTNRFGAGADFRFSKFTTLSSRYEQTWVSFDRPEIFLTGGWIHALRNELTHRLSQHLALGGEYELRAASLDDGNRTFTFQDAGGVMRLNLGPHTSASASGGFALLHDRNANETRTGPYVKLGISHLIERATIGAAFERQFVPSFGFGGSSSSQELRGFVAMPLRQGLYTQGSAAWRRSDPFQANTLELDTIWIRSTIGYAIARQARMEVLYTYTRQDSIITGGEVDRHRIGVQFVVSQPMRIQ